MQGKSQSIKQNKDTYLCCLGLVVLQKRPFLVFVPCAHSVERIRKQSVLMDYSKTYEITNKKHTYGVMTNVTLGSENGFQEWLR